MINVKAKKDQGSDMIYNEIKGYSQRENQVAPPPSVQPQQYPQAPLEPGAAPWERSQQPQ